MGRAVTGAAGFDARELGLAKGFGFGQTLGKVFKEQVHQSRGLGIVDLPK